MTRYMLIPLVVSLLSAGACVNKTCTALGIVREMPFEATIPQASTLDPASLTLELCFGTVCDTAQLRTSPNPNLKGKRCEDVDGRTPSYPTQCTYDETERSLKLTTNTVYGGHEGSDRLVLTAVAASGARTELLRGTVRYEDTTDDSARGACTEAWKGTFTKD
jgi:hypothetical protein